MYRCALIAPLLALSLSLQPIVAQAQAARPFPAHALRGELTVTQSPAALIDQRPVRLAPGVRIQGTNNLLVLPGSLTGQKVTVHYTLGLYGLVNQVWILNPSELANAPWPRTSEEAAAWRFDPDAQRWIKP